MGTCLLTIRHPKNDFISFLFFRFAYGILCISFTFFFSQICRSFFSSSSFSIVVDLGLLGVQSCHLIGLNNCHFRFLSSFQMIALKMVSPAVYFVPNQDGQRQSLWPKELLQREEKGLVKQLDIRSDQKAGNAGSPVAYL